MDATSATWVGCQFLSLFDRLVGSTIFLDPPTKFHRRLLPSLLVSLPSSEVAGLNMVLGLDLLPLGLHFHHDTRDLSGEGLKYQRSGCRESRVEVEAAVEGLQTRKSYLPRIVFWIEENSVIFKYFQHLKYHLPGSRSSPSAGEAMLLKS